ncbi:MAG: Hsp20/alpha crystallin family protein [Candidatus Muiribacteriota bacterium]
MKMQKWNPLNEMLDLSNTWKNFFDEDESFFPSGLLNESGKFKVDVYEKDNKVNIDAELPGMKKDDISITLEDGYLTIAGKSEKNNEVKEKDYFYSERSSGSFSRTFQVGDDVTEKDINAEYNDGILHVSFKKPQIEKKNVKKISVK